MGKYRQFIKYYQSFHPIVWTLLGGTIIMRIVQFMSLPFLTIILVTEIKVDLVTAGFTVGLSALTGTIGGFIGGNLSDRFGRKWIAVGSLFLGGLSFAGIAIADSAWQFMLLNGLIGLFRTFFETTARALMADFTIQEKRFRVFALRYWAINVGVSIGPLLGAILAVYSSQLAFFITTIVYIIYALFLWYLLNKYILEIKSVKNHSSQATDFFKTIRIIAQNRAFVYYLLACTIITIGFSQIQSSLPIYMKQTLDSKGAFYYPWLLSLNAVMVVILQMTITSWAEKRKLIISILLGILLFSLGFVMFSFGNPISMFFIGMIFYTLGEVLLVPAFNVLLDRCATENLRGSYYGASNIQSLGDFIGPMFGGWLLLKTGGSWAYLLMAIIFLGSGLFFWACNQKLKNQEGEREKETATS